jgi:hypothetical protein
VLLLIIGVSLLREVRAGFHPPRYAAFLTSPSPSFGHSSRLGWDDEQVTTWFNRQVDASQIDAPFGVAGYRIDARDHGAGAWHSLCRVTGALSLGATALGVAARNDERSDAQSSAVSDAD